MHLSSPLPDEAGAGCHSLSRAVFGNLLQLALHRFSDAAHHLRLKVVGQREPEQARADVWRCRTNLAVPCRAQFSTRHGLQCIKFGAKVDHAHSGATAR